MTKDEALALALEALEYIHEGANNQGPHTGISWRCVAVKAEPAITAIKQARALDKKAENAKELGLDYEPVGEAYLCNKCQTPFDGAWECPNCGHRSATKESFYTTPPAAQRQWVGLTDEELRQRLEEERKAEREACAKVCYELPWKDGGHIPSNLAFAAAIRARNKP